MCLYRHSKGGGAYYPGCTLLMSVIRRIVAVASAMFTRRAEAGSAEARRAGANGALKTRLYCIYSICIIHYSYRTSDINTLPCVIINTRDSPEASVVKTPKSV